MKYLKTCLFISLSAIAFAACGKQEAPGKADSTQSGVVASNIKVGSAEGVVRAMDPVKHTVTLDHKTVPGIMDSMTMEYQLTDPALAGVARVGDTVDFTMEDHGQGQYFVSALKIKH